MFEAASIEDIQSAHRRLAGITLRTPTVKFDAAPAGKQLHLKLENLQPVGSFKLRPIGNAVLSKSAPALADGIHTASSGNSALAVAWMARRVGIPATAVVPNNVPENKLELLRRLDAKIVRLPFEQWWESIALGSHPGIDGLYIDAVRDPAALAGNGTAGLEILEDLARLDAIFVPFGGGGLACGIASAVRTLRPAVKIIACELETAHPLKSAMRAGHPVTGPYDAGFVTGVGFGSVLPESWRLAKEMIDEVMTVSLQEVAGAVRIMAERNKVIAEGAGAIPVAAALSGRYDYERVCAVVSGGNIDKDVLVKILRGETPL
jgi:threonine dehydratase